MRSPPTAKPDRRTLNSRYSNYENDFSSPPSSFLSICDIFCTKKKKTKKKALNLPKNPPTEKRPRLARRFSAPSTKNSHLPDSRGANESLVTYFALARARSPKTPIRLGCGAQTEPKKLRKGLFWLGWARTFFFFVQSSLGFCGLEIVVISN